MNKNTFSEAKTYFLKPQIRSVVYSMVFTFLAFLILAVVMTFTTVGESAAEKSVIAITVAAVIIAGFLQAKSASSRGWMWGALGGLIYTAVLWIISGAAMGSFGFGIKTIIAFVLSAVVGAAGGIIGINSRK